jgi:hypothetical protein
MTMMVLGNISTLSSPAAKNGSQAERASIRLLKAIYATTISLEPPPSHQPSTP